MNNDLTRVIEAYTMDVGKGIIRLNEHLMRNNNILDGDVILIKGKRTTVGIARSLHKKEIKVNISRMDGLMRNNAGVQVNDTVSIERIDAVQAMDVQVSPIEPVPSVDGRYIAERLEGVAICKNDNIMIPYFGGRLIYKVDSIHPSNKAVLVERHTRFEVIEALETSKSKEPKKEDQEDHREFIGRRIFSIQKDVKELENIHEFKQNSLITIVWNDFLELVDLANDSFPNNDFIPKDLKTLEELQSDQGNTTIFQYIKLILRKVADALNIKHLEVNLTEKTFGSDIFIVHGHDEMLKEKTARFIEKMGLKSIILHEQPNKGRTIIEKFEDYSSKIGFAVILLTSDDSFTYKKNNEEIVEKRARQNVILELGFFAGTIGRKRTCVLYEEGVELPSDYDGVLYIPIDKKDAWKLGLAKEIKESGIHVDLNKIV